MDKLDVFPFYEICGALHLHTLYSDGGIGYPELIEVARDVGLDFIVVTDHMSLKGKEEGYEKFHGNMIVVVGYEHNDKDNKNHYLAIGTDRVFDELVEAAEYTQAVKNCGGIGFLAHPFEKRNYLKRYPPYPWTEWDVEDYDGIELWNQMSEWLENLTSRLKIFHLFHPRSFLREIPRDNLAFWDKLNMKRFVSAIAGVDAHTMKTMFGFFGFKIFPIKVELKGLRTHLYIDQPVTSYNFTTAKEKLLLALKYGHGFISNYRCADARGSKIVLHDALDRIFKPGYTVTPYALPATIKVVLPRQADIRLIKDGQQVASCINDNTFFPVTEKGIYRIEIFIKEKAWIYSNPFPVNLNKHNPT